MVEKISPYSYPILNYEMLDIQKYPYISSCIRLAIDNIHMVICEEFKVNADYYTINSRKREYVEARKVLSVILLNEQRWTLEKIGQYMGGRDHTTIIHSRNTMYDIYDTDYEFRLKVTIVYRRLKKHFKK
jgi:chromosomal replication initiator protein